MGWPYLMDAETAAKYVSVGVNQIRRLGRDGRIETKLQGSTVKYLRSDLEAYANSLPAANTKKQRIENARKAAKARSGKKAGNGTSFG